MTNRLLALCAGLALACLLPAAAFAAPGYANAAVNMRSGPGTHFRVITTIPAGARVEVYNCTNWCEVEYRSLSGWVSARYIDAAARYRPPVVERPPVPDYRYRRPYDPFRPYPRRDPYCGPGALYGGIYCELRPH